MTGRSRLQEMLSVLASPPPAASIFASATTVFMKTAAMYQATSMARHTTVTGIADVFILHHPHHCHPGESRDPELA